MVGELPKPAPVERLSQIADCYDLFLIDQWGVLHNGAAPHEGAVAALQMLHAAGKTIVVISNSSKRRTISLAGMAALGIEPALVDHVVTSGEEAWQAFAARRDPFYATLGRRCVMFTWGGDKRFLEGLDLEEVDDVADADFILNAGTRGKVTLDDYEPVLQEGAARGLPMVCLNPDFVSIDPDGNIVLCPGSLARRYEELGGYVRYHGKPCRSIYETCFRLAGPYRRALAIGDSLHHDIAGANGVGIDSLLVTAGIHAKDLAAELAGDRLAALCAEAGCAPTYVTQRLRW